MEKIILESICNWLRKNYWEFSLDEGQEKIWIFQEMSNRFIGYLQILVKPENSMYAVYGLSPFGFNRKDDELNCKLGKFVNMANSRLEGIENLGKFELTHAFCVRFKCTVDCSEGAPSDKTIENSLWSTVSAFYHYSEGLTEIIYSNKDAVAAFEKCNPVELDEMLAIF